MKHTYTFIIVFFLMTLSCNKIVAQDIHFTQFDVQAVGLNPGLTGWYKGDIRASAIYRTQWKAIDNKEYRTIGLSFEKQFHHYLNIYNVGIQVINDETGYVGLTTNKINISGGYSTKINGHSISGGIQIGGVYKSTKTLQYTYDEQFDLGGNNVFNSSLPISETKGEPISYISINAGAAWSYKITKHIEPEIGIALFHINTPQESFYNANYPGTKLGLQKIAHIGGKVTFSNKMYARPLLLYMNQTKATNFLIGGTAHYKISEHLTPYGGVLFRYSWISDYDASAFRFGAQYKSFDIGMSYDLNVSTLHPATNNRGAFEISITYISKSLHSRFIKIPCDRQ